MQITKLNILVKCDDFLYAYLCQCVCLCRYFSVGRVAKEYICEVQIKHIHPIICNCSYNYFVENSNIMLLILTYTHILVVYIFYMGFKFMFHNPVKSYNKNPYDMSLYHVFSQRIKYTVISKYLSLTSFYSPILCGIRKTDDQSKNEESIIHSSSVRFSILQFNRFRFYNRCDFITTV